MAQGNGGGGGNGGGNGGGENKKAEEILPHPHPVEEQLPGIQYCVNSPPPWRSYTSSISFSLALLV